MPEIINPGQKDYHCHSTTYSDGMSSVDEIVRFAGDIGLKELAITDHSQVSIEANGLHKETFRGNIYRWKNVFNNVKVIFGIETDLLNEKGDFCKEIDGDEGKFLLLSAHGHVYSGNPRSITKAFVNAVEKHAKEFKFIAHPCSHDLKYLEIEPVIQLANEYELPMELNCTNFVRKKTDMNKLEKMLRDANKIIVNSDAHNLYELKQNRQFGLGYLMKEGLL